MTTMRRTDPFQSFFSLYPEQVHVPKFVTVQPGFLDQFKPSTLSQVHNLGQNTTILFGFIIILIQPQQMLDILVAFNESRGDWYF